MDTLAEHLLLSCFGEAVPHILCFLLMQPAKEHWKHPTLRYQKIMVTAIFIIVKATCTSVDKFFEISSELSKYLTISLLPVSAASERASFQTSSLCMCVRGQYKYNHISFYSAGSYN